jgi:hypothetical protein
METGEAAVLAPAGGVRYAGELVNTEHHRMLPDGSTCVFRFKVEWSNGYVQTHDVPVRVRESMYEVIVQQNRH